MKKAWDTFFQQMKITMKLYFIFLMMQFIVGLFISPILFIVKNFRNSTSISMSIGVISGFLGLIFTLVTLKILKEEMFSFLKTTRKFLFSNLQRGLFFTLFLITPIFLIFGCLGIIEFNTRGSSFECLIFIPILLIGAFVEEALFRNIILNKLINSDSKNNFSAILVTSIFFSLMHIFNNYFNVMAFINTILFGGLLGILKLSYKNFYIVWFTHFFWNFISGVVLGSPVSGFNIPSLYSYKWKGPEILHGGNYGIEASIVTSMVLVSGIILEIKKGAKILNNAEYQNRHQFAATEN